MSLKRKVLANKDMLFRLALRLLNNHHDAEDAVSEVFVKVWKNIDRFSKYDNLEKVLFRTIRNQCIDMLRGKKDFKQLDEMKTSDFNQEKKDELMGSSKFLEIQNIINELPEKQKLMIHLRMIEGYTMNQIAEIMEEKVNTVEVSISRARKKIRSEYEKRKH